MEMILPLLRQLNAFSRSVIERVVLTENIPEPDLVTDLTVDLPVERIFNSSPKGFGANHNQAFKKCSSPWFLVLNPDIRLDNNVLKALLTQAHPESGLLTPRILEPGKTEPEQHRGVITPLEILTRRRPGYTPPKTPAWIPGLFMLFRQKTYAQIGGFDENRFFMYGEDFDICARTRLAGWQLQVCEDLHATHDAQRASHRSHRHLYWHITSLLKVWTSVAFWRYRRIADR